MQIVNLKIDDLKPYEKNARKHQALDVAAIAESIKAFGFRDPVGIWGPNNIIVEGHGRVMAARQLGMETVPCIRLDDLTDEQRRAYALAHNKTAELSAWDMTILPAELQDIHGFDMTAFGFIPPAETGTEDDYQEPDQTKEPNARRGQLWLLGEHRLLCGDATDPEDMRRLMAGDQADLLVTDPPYNVGYDGGTRPREEIANDSQDSERFRKFLTDAFRNAADVMRPGAAFYIWHAHAESVNFFEAAAAAGLQIRQLLVWAKQRFNFGRQDYQWQHEPCMYGWKDGAAHYFVDDRTQTTVYEDRPTVSLEHPTMKPVRLIARLLRNSSRTGEIVLDMFGGSGTTLIACQQLKRRCRIMELDPHYVDVIIDRWQRMTGEEAVLIDD